eukprot:4709124-Amphidinium_carterae.1
MTVVSVSISVPAELHASIFCEHWPRGIGGGMSDGSVSASCELDVMSTCSPKGDSISQPNNTKHTKTANNSNVPFQR